MKKPLFAFACAIGTVVVSDVSIAAATPAPAPETIAMPAWASSLPSDAEITNERRDAIQHEARAFAERATTEQRRDLVTRLVTDPTCGRAHAAALAGAFTAGIEPAIVSDALSSMTTQCNAVVVESAGFVPNPDASIAVALSKLTREDPTHEAAWLSFGAIAETARTSGDVALAASIDAAIAPALAASEGEEHLLLVRAAGNAGCVECAPGLARDATSSDPTLRRAAVAAHRFLSSEAAVTQMCAALDGDGDASARDLAAWALEWRTTHPAQRTECLERAAVRDGSKGVRLQAVRALGILSDDVPSAEEALVRLSARRGDVGTLAARTLAVRAPIDESDVDVASLGER